MKRPLVERRTQKEKETKRKSLSVKTGLDLANKAQHRKNMYFCPYRSVQLMELMWALGWLGTECSQRTAGAKMEIDINEHQKWR